MSENVPQTQQWGNIYEVEFDAPLAGGIGQTPAPTKVFARTIEEAAGKARNGWISNEVVSVKRILSNVQA